MGGIDLDATVSPIEAQQRRRILIFAAALFAVVLVIAGIVFAYDQGDKPRLIDASDTTTSTTARAAIEVPGVFVTTTAAPAVPVTTTSTTRPPRRTTTTQTEFPDAPAELTCATTTSATPTPAPDDWADYWTKEPKQNEGMELKICVEDATPKVGTTVKLYVLARDKDAQIGSGPCDVFARWTSNDSEPDCPQRDTVYAPPSEPKPTPTAKEGRVRLTFVHEYAEAGESIIEVRAWSPPETAERQPYASYNSIELRVNVHR